MSAQRKAAGITRQHAESLGEVLAWLRTQPGIDPLTLGVVEDVQGRVETRAKQGALFRVRLKNAGTPPDERMSHVGRNWQPDELAALDRLWREGITVAEIADRLGRTASSVDAQISRLHLFGVRTKPLARLVNYRPQGSPLCRAKQVIAERRRRERLAEREVG